MRTDLKHLILFFAWTALLPTLASAQSVSADRRLEAYISLNQFASPYAGAQFPVQWCYYRKVDGAYNWWYVKDAVSGALEAVEGRGGYEIPFAYGPARATGGMLVAYVIDGGLPVLDLDPVPPFTTNAPDCAVGLRILTDSPYPIVGLAKNLAAQSVIDPAPEYRFWSIYRKFHRVRQIAAVPASFQVGSNQAAGRIILGFTGDW